MRHKSNLTMAGFTLVELMIAVVIIAILAAIAAPNYTEYVRRGNRAEATAALMESAARLQQHYTLSNSYVGTVGFKDSSKYTVSHATGSPTATTFTLQATTVSGYTDPRCGTFTITQSGQRGMTSGTGTVADCWAGR